MYFFYKIVMQKHESLPTRIHNTDCNAVSKTAVDFQICELSVSVCLILSFSYQITNKFDY